MKVHFEERGKGNPGPIIMVHGAGGSSATWYMQIKHLSNRLHMIGIDLNGHGKTPDRKEINLTQGYLKDIDAIVTQFEKPVLCGHSMGGALTQLYALEKPDNLAGIILVGTGARLRVNLMIFNLIENDFDGYVNAVGEIMFHGDADETLREASRVEVRKCPASITYRDYTLCNEFDIMDGVADINLPALVIVGDSDALTPVKYSQYLADKIEGSEMHIIPNAGHSVMLEQWESFNDVVANWYQSIQG
ncbi:MAG: alpha/beta fold hydrolase [Candidatus Thorarchaeota archaeon]|jgi:pimeloyl-ACP methyl ester carboxylesterase